MLSTKEIRNKFYDLSAHPFTVSESISSYSWDNHDIGNRIAFSEHDVRNPQDLSEREREVITEWFDSEDYETLVNSK